MDNTRHPYRVMYINERKIEFFRCPHNVPPPWQPWSIMTNDRDAVQRELNKIVSNCDELHSMVLYGDEHCRRRDYIEWSKDKVVWLQHLLEKIDG